MTLEAETETKSQSCGRRTALVTRIINNGAGRRGARKAACQRVPPPLGASPFLGCRPARMKTARKKPTAAKLLSWRVIIIRRKGEYLGSVEAPDRGDGF
jgi:hypothetical protein